MSRNYEAAAKMLAEAFSPEAVKVCSQYHIQVSTRGGKHNVFSDKSGALKMQLHGKRHPKSYASVRAIITAIQSYDPKSSDLSRIKSAVDLAEFIGVAKHYMPDGADCAVFVDAGWKDGIGNIAIVELRRMPLGIRVIAHSEFIETESSHTAEMQAIIEGLAFNTLATVFSDCKSAVDSHPCDRVKWIPRERNKIADRIGNRRK